MPPKHRMRHLSTFMVLVSFALVSCGLQEEVARVSSPDGQVEAVLIETDGGATTSFGYRILVAKKGSWFPGEEVAWLYGAFRNEQAYGVNFKWCSDTELCVEYLNARQTELKKPSIYVKGRNIEVTLHSGLADPTAPAGGMLYNLRKGRNDSH